MSQYKISKYFTATINSCFFIQKVFFGLFFLAANALFASSPLSINSKFTYTSLGEYVTIFEDSTHQYTISDILDPVSKPVFQKNISNKLKLGQAYSTFWIRLPLSNQSAVEKQLIAEISHSELDTIRAYVVKDGALQHTFLSGESVPIKDRIIQNNYFCFPIDVESNELLVVYFYVDLRLEPLNVRFGLYDKHHFLKIQQNVYYFHGLYGGLLFFVSLLSIVFAVAARQKVFYYYMIYSISVNLLSLSYTNLGYQYLWQDAFWFAHWSRLIFGLITALALVVFTFEYFKAHTVFQKLRPLYNATVFLMIGGLFIFPIFFTNRFFPGVWQHTYFIPSILIAFCMLGVQVLILVVWIQTRKPEYFIILLAYSLMNSCAIIRFLVSVEFFEVTFFTENIVPFAAMVEQIFLCVLLLFNIQQNYFEKIKLSESLVEAKENSFKLFFSGQRQERTRLSQNLHDGTSLHLANIQMHLSTLKHNVKDPEQLEKFQYILKELDVVSNDIRNFSHALSPVVLERYGLIFALEDLVGKLETAHQNIQFKFEYTSFERQTFNEFAEQSLYFIAQELLHNSLKHSKASIITMLLIKKESAIKLSVQDNGVGYNTEIKHSSGIGLQNITTRCTLINANFQVENLHKGGVQHVIQMPI